VIGLPDLANKNTKCPVNFEFLMNNNFLELVCPIQYLRQIYTNFFVTYLKFTFNGNFIFNLLTLVIEYARIRLLGSLLVIFLELWPVSPKNIKK